MSRVRVPSLTPQEGPGRFADQGLLRSGAFSFQSLLVPGPSCGRGSVPVPPAADLPPGHAEDGQDDADDEQDDPDGPQDRDVGDEPDDQENEAEEDHDASSALDGDSDGARPGICVDG